MSIPDKDKPLFTNIEKERLTNPNLDSNIKKRNNLIVKRKIQSWLNDAEDVLFALKSMNEIKIKDSVEDKNIYTIFRIIETLINKMDFEPVSGYPQHPYITISVGSGIPKDRLQNIRAKESDLERNWQVQEFVRYLESCYNDPEKESLAYKTFRSRKEYEGIVTGCAKFGLKPPDQTDEEWVNMP